MNNIVTLLNNFLQEIVKKNTYCKTCEFNHSGICFFSFECIGNNFIHYMDNEIEK